MKRRRLAAVYAIHGPSGVYVGQSVDCWNRTNFQLAIILGLECGIVRELHGRANTPEGRLRAEADVAALFARRGFRVVSSHRGRSLFGRYVAEHRVQALP